MTIKMIYTGAKSITMENRYDLKKLLHEIVEDEELFSKKKKVKMSQEEIKKLLRQKQKGIFQK
jgi:hypothetical protein